MIRGLSLSARFRAHTFLSPEQRPLPGGGGQISFILCTLVVSKGNEPRHNRLRRLIHLRSGLYEFQCKMKATFYL